MTTQQEQNVSELNRIIALAWRRKWVILAPFVIIGTLVSLWGLYIPNLYRSSSSIFIEPQEVPTEYVRSTVTSDIEGRLRTIRQQLTNRTKLLKVAKELDLYPGIAAAGAPNEVLVARMRNDLEIDSPGRREQNFFTVSYNHADPTKAMLTVTRLVSLFIEESLQVREQQAAGTTEFIEDELETLKKVLEKQEAAIQDYKKRHMGQLPGQLDANLRMLDNLQLQLTDNLESQRDLDNRVVLLEQDVSRLEEQLRLATGITDDQGGADTPLGQLLAQKDALNREIVAMEAQYTARHPDLVRARKELTAVEEKIRAAAATPGRDAAAAVPGSGASTELGNLRRQLENQKLQLASLKTEEEELRGRLALYQRRVEITPTREQQLLKLTRDYENTKNSYEELLSKKQGARLSENLERRQKGEKFQILDPANLPEKPYLPNRPKILALGLAGGLGVGIALALLLEALSPAYHSVSELKAHTTLPLVLGIPVLAASAEKKQQRVRIALMMAGGCVLLAGLLLLVNYFVVDLAEVGRQISFNLRSMFL